MRGKRFNFWKNVNKPRECWEWTAAIDNGYGKIWNGKKMEWAHRFSYRMEVGPIPDGYMVCHHCDNPKCVRPDHLFIGTALDNARDMLKKKRGFWNPARGENVKTAKLNDDAVRAIRREYKPRKVTLKMLGDKYGVSLDLIFLVVKNRAWKHVV